MNSNTIRSTGYDVIFDDTLAELHQFIQHNSYSKILILTDRNTCTHCLPLLQDALPGFDGYDVIEVDPGEENKNIDFCVGIWRMMLDFGADRQSLLINLGGGVVTDMGGFTASTFKRGIDFVQVPTTLLAQVDASVGGKTGVDMDNVKNIIGTFAQPKAVFIASTFLRTLEKRQLVSGFAEVIKHGLIADRPFYEAVKELDATALSLEHIRHSVSIKNKVVTEDPLERGLRKILNFGHTIGHALEGYSLANDRNPLLHGEAIAAGMICEAYLAHRLNGLSEKALEDIINTFRRHFPDYSYTREIYDELLVLMKNDKKNAGNRIGFALPGAVGQCSIDVFVEESLIVESLDFYRKITT
ncbi:3-dehydroquinate synthase [Parapedobacter indicus]|uniref:3-dehydroquinate synthase n=1 Tax=Parapedobacter indicus TaxID=1477437 RepID=A0A1I3CWS6_9SPHI|nr:3-dehydroquinate synthase [Parapedobacter indicus]PPL04424.1 3-dehydroquinate synthase [Parapedobacter indicus]SFH78729.1 3-dehydroquinate synthase [Parapedobacter indicus]